MACPCGSPQGPCACTAPSHPGATPESAQEPLRASDGLLVHRLRDYELVMGAGTTYIFEIYVILGRQIDRSFQEQIDSYLQPAGATSIKAAVDADQTLGGVAAFAVVRSVNSSLQSMDFAGVTYAAATVQVEVVAQP